MSFGWWKTLILEKNEGDFLLELVDAALWWMFSGVLRSPARSSGASVVRCVGYGVAPTARGASERAIGPLCEM